MIKKIYPFHYRLVDKHLAELNETGETIIKSSFLLNILKNKNPSINITPYRSLKINKFRWSGTCEKRLWSQSNYPRILKLIDKNRIDKNELEELLNESYFWNMGKLTVDDIDSLFDKNSDKNRRLDIIDKLTDKYCKFGYLYRINIYKLYYKITCI